ncbi:MAG: hypothetical protein WB565_00155 [Acidimicrobiales bacterium]
MTTNRQILEDLACDFSPSNVASVAEAWQVPVSRVRTVARQQRTIFESSPTYSEDASAEVSDFQRERAQTLAERANHAEKDLSRATHQDLEALAALTFPRR